MKINPNSSHYVSPSGERQRSKREAERASTGNSNDFRDQSTVNNRASTPASAKNPTSTGRYRPSNPALAYQENAAADQANSSQNPNNAQLSPNVDYFSAQARDAQAFYVGESQAHNDDNRYYSGQVHRLNSQLTKQALDSYRSHQQMDDEQSQRQEHQIVLGVDTYV